MTKERDKKLEWYKAVREGKDHAVKEKNQQPKQEQNPVLG